MSPLSLNTTLRWGQSGMLKTPDRLRAGELLARQLLLLMLMRRHVTRTSYT